MATLERQEIVDALRRLGELADANGTPIELLIVGGAVMVLEFQARASTRDVDVVILSPSDPAVVRALARTVASERGWPEDWLNDAVKEFLVGSTVLTEVLSMPGIRVCRPSIEQLLPMKLCAWRDDVDISDATRLLQVLSETRDEVWRQVYPHLQRGRELKAQYAFADLWEQIHGKP